MTSSAFEFATAARIVFGQGKALLLPDFVAKQGKRAFVVTGANHQRHASLLQAIEATGVTVRAFSVSHEPTTDDAIAAVTSARSHAADVVIGLGGGSAIDLAKAAAALVPNPGEPMDYLEVVGKGRPLEVSPLPCIAVPTTAGTGAEVTKNAVLGVTASRVKVSLRSATMLPDIALVDPALTLEVPPAVTASTGFDALAQVIEPFVSHLATPLTDALCKDGIALAARSLARAYEKGDDINARSDMALTSLFGGLALANAKLGAVHGFAGPLGGMYRAPHGALCAALLPATIRQNVMALRQRAPQSPALARFDEVGRLLAGRRDADSNDAIAWCAATARQLAIPGLSAYGIERADFAAIAQAASRASSMKGNPISLESSELGQILEASL